MKNAAFLPNALPLHGTADLLVAEQVSVTRAFIKSYVDFVFTPEGLRELEATAEMIYNRGSRP